MLSPARLIRIQTLVPRRHHRSRDDTEARGDERLADRTPLQFRRSHSGGPRLPLLPVPRARPAMRPSPGTLAAIANTRPPSPSAGDEARDSDAVQLRSTADDFA